MATGPLRPQRLRTLVLVASLLAGGPAAAQVATSTAGIYADGRDPWTLLRPSTVNRDLRRQGRDRRGAQRRFLDVGPFSALVDGRVGWQQPIGTHPQSRWHGYYVLDTYVGVRLIEQLELTLNLTIYNPSASDGYRTSADILPGLTVHLQESFDVDGTPLRFDIIGFDLDVVTTGIGLFYEQLPVEGWIFGGRYGASELRITWGGRALFSDDNFILAEATFFDRRIGLSYHSWFGDLNEVDITPTRQNSVDSFHAVYVGAFLDLPLTADLRLGAEYAGRIDTGVVRSSAMVRLDYKRRLAVGFPLDVHVGYQARLYASDFGPRSLFVVPTQTPNTPRREDVYVTNSYEYFQYTPFFDQRSHTGVAEVRARPFAQWQAFAEVEYWIRFAEAAAPRVIGNSRFGALPGTHENLFYRCGLEFFPWSDLPHRVSAFATNKAVVAATNVRDDLPDRLDHRDFFYIEGVFFL